MKIIKTEMIGGWSLKPIFLILLGYFFVLFPLFNIIFREFRWAGEYIYSGYYLLTIVLIATIYKARAEHFGFSRGNIFQNILIGGISGGALLISLPLLDFLIDVSGLANSELFTGAEFRVNSTVGLNNKILTTVLAPIIEQVFFSGIILQSLLKKLKPITAIYIATIIFALAHFNVQLGTLIVGLTTGFFYYKTGTIYAGILFQILCGASGILIQYAYPRLTTILVFLN
ncbi:MAG: CPBP family glutamic-type intramembrane protease [Nitrospinales bacterium]